MKRLQMKRLLPIVGLLIALIGIVITIFWGQYTGRKSLEIRIMSIMSLLEKDPVLDELTISYKDKVITNLTKVQFVVLNTGRTPITEEDVKVFPTIDFGPKAELLLTKILRMDPPNINCSITRDQDPSKVTLKFSLLNPTDFVEFSVYITGLIEESFIVNSRIKGIKQVNVVDKTAGQIKPSRRVGWTIYMVGIFTLLLAVSFFPSVQERRIHLRTRKLLADNPHLLEKMTEKSEFERFIGDNISFVTNGEMKKLRSILYNDTREFLDQKANLVSLITQYIKAPSGVEIVYYAVILLVPVGILYVLWQLFQ